MNTKPPIRIASHVIQTGSRWFVEAAALEVEDMIVAAGVRLANGTAVVTSALHPNVEREPGWYEQRRDQSWHDLYTYGREHELEYILQVHTHPPGCSTRHSQRDDSGAFSDEVGFLSIVVPNFGVRGLDLHDPAVTVHERTRPGWRIWTKEEARQRLVVFPSAVDFQEDAYGL